MQRLTITVWKIIFLCTCVWVNSICRKLDWIFKHMGLTSGTHAYVCMEWHGILIPKNLEKQKHMNLAWCNVMPPIWRGTKIDLFDESLDTYAAHTQAPHYKARGSEREQCMFDDEWEIASSYGLQFFLRLTCTTTTVM